MKKRLTETNLTKSSRTGEVVEQEAQLENDSTLRRYVESRQSMAADTYRPHYHFVSPEGRLNDPNGLCFGKRSRPESGDTAQYTGPPLTHQNSISRPAQDVATEMHALIPSRRIGCPNAPCWLSYTVLPKPNYYTS